MAKKILLSLVAMAVIAFAGCSEKLAYNSQSGVNGSRDSASQLLVNTNLTEDISDPKADNEDWFYFTPPEKGLINIKVFIDRPQDLIVTIAVRDGFGRTLYTMTSNHSEREYVFSQFEVEPERYFISLITTDGESSYTLRADFEVPPPPPVIEEPVIEDPGPTTAPRCKGSSCKKTTTTTQQTDDGGLSGKPTIKGTIVLVTPRGENLCEIKMNGLGKNKGVKPGAKAYLRGLNRKVDINNCLNTSCTGTVKATSEELAHYDTVDVEVD